MHKLDLLSLLDFHARDNATLREAIAQIERLYDALEKIANHPRDITGGTEMVLIATRALKP